MSEADKIELVYSLIGFPNETEWLEFKEGNSDPQRIGKDISALANAAAYLGREWAYKIWGVDDESHALVGTSFDPMSKKGKGGQDLLIWLSKILSANANYEFDCFEHDGLSFVVLKIAAAVGQPVTFDKTAYIREGSATSRLKAGSEKEAELWRRLQTVDFELCVAERDVLEEEVQEKLDVDAYFSLVGSRKPESIEGMVQHLCEAELLRRQDNARLSITNLGVLLVGRSLTAFQGLRKRPLRILRFAGRGNFDILDDVEFDEGYALALPKAEKYAMSHVVTGEISTGAFRRVVSPYPQRAVREMLANAVLHQDLSDATAGPLVSIYENRIEFSNPGTTLIPVKRVLNAQPRSRNAALASIMRQMDLCEEGGTGWDLAVASCEDMHIAAPKMVSEDDFGTKVTLLAGSAYEHMTKAERREAAYWHACLMFAQGEAMNNQSLRERFGLDAQRKNVVAISRLIRECCDAGLLKDEDGEASDKYRRYVPSWA